jgi:hypothetical protein
MAANERPFSCTEPDEAFLSPAFLKLGSDPVETPSDPATIVGVLIDVERFK